jgi:membrane associated rhomboid family serine protease
VSESCPVCGAELPDRTEAWLHFQEEHANGAPGPRATQPSPPAPSAPAPRWPVPASDPSVPSAGAAPGSAPDGVRPVRSPGIWRQGWSDSPATMAVIVVTIGVYVLHYVLLKTVGIDTNNSLAGNGLMGTDGQWWRLITPVVVHFGIAHITFNLLWVYQFGPPIERLVGRVGFVAIYVTTAVAGNVCSDAVYWHRANFISGGASGAVYGLGGVLVGAWLTARWIAKHHPGPPRPGSIQFNDQVIRSIAILFGAYLVLAQLILPVDSAAHFGGGLLGLIIGGAIAWRRNGPKAVVVY